MTAKLCDVCRAVIEQQHAEYLELRIRVLDSTENPEQDEKAQAYGDFCDGCIANGSALTNLLQQLDWTLEPRPPSQEPSV